MGHLVGGYVYYTYMFLSRYAKRQRGSEKERGGKGRETEGCTRVQADTSESERRYELPKLPFDSSDKLCKQFDRRSYRFAVEL